MKQSKKLAAIGLGCLGLLVVAVNYLNYLGFLIILASGIITALYYESKRSKTK